MKLNSRYLILGLSALVLSSTCNQVFAQEQLNDVADNIVADIMNEFLPTETLEKGKIITTNCTAKATNNPSCNCSASGTSVTCWSTPNVAMCYDGQTKIICISAGGVCTCNPAATPTAPSTEN